MTARINEIKLDIDDLSCLLEKALRQKSKDILNLEIRRLQTELSKLQCQLNEKQENKVSKPTTDTTSKCYDIKLYNYAYDQTQEFIKIYVTLNKVQFLPKEAIFCNFTSRSMDLHVKGLDNKNYELTINNLCEDIDEAKSYYKVKKNMIIVFLSKKIMNYWTYVTSVEKKIKDAYTAPSLTDDSSDPRASLMNLMKKMYDEGNDEIKKTIVKAWTERQDEKMPDLGELPDI